ncbi:MAG: CDP-alcohol phosphatidyltransferase family protein [Phocaeicola sp.]
MNKIDKREKTTLSSTYKSIDTEEFLDIHFNRPIGYLWALLFQRLNIHPNVITIVSIVIGAAAGVMFYFPDLYHNMIGMGLLIWANHYDSADGQLARMTGKKTLWGRILDGFAGDVWFFCIYAAICLRLMPTWGFWIWALAALAGLVFHSKQCALSDYYRNIHLFFLKGKEGSELDNGLQQQVLFASKPWRGNFWYKMFHFFYARYTFSQEQMSPAFQRFFALVKERYGSTIPTSLQQAFRKGSLPLMKYANILTFNTRAIALFISLFIDMPWLYFVFELTVMNVLFFYMRARHEALCKQLTLSIQQTTDEK